MLGQGVYTVDILMSAKGMMGQGVFTMGNLMSWFLRLSLSGVMSFK
jgi:hypothetical protein